MADSGQSEFQPAISPDGDRICYTHSNNGFNNTADIRVALVTDPPNPPAPGVVFSQDAAVGEYNCTWSPDSTLIAYVHGIFGAGRLLAFEADGSDPLGFELAQDTGANNFDGNPDWAPDGRPQCPNLAVTTTRGQAVSIPVECTDSGPEYEHSNVREFVTAQPQNGTTEQDLAGDPVIYTPNANFVGVDTFEIGSFDEFGFGSDRGTVVVTVNAPTPPDDPPGGGGGADTTPPVGTLTGKGTQDVDKLKLKAGANEAATASGQARVNVKGAKKPVTSKAATATIAANATAKLKFKFKRKTLKAIKAQLEQTGKAKAKIAVTFTDAAGNQCDRQYEGQAEGLRRA